MDDGDDGDDDDDDNDEDDDTWIGRDYFDSLVQGYGISTINVQKVPQCCNKSLVVSCVVISILQHFQSWLRAQCICTEQHEIHSYWRLASISSKP